jgi:hypothetical protein
MYSPTLRAVGSKTMADDDNLKNREDRLRRLARQRGLLLKKSRRRDPRASDFGVYYLIDPESNGLLAACPSLDDVEREIETLRDGRADPGG